MKVDNKSTYMIAITAINEQAPAKEFTARNIHVTANGLEFILNSEYTATDLQLLLTWFAKYTQMLGVSKEKENENTLNIEYLDTGKSLNGQPTFAVGMFANFDIIESIKF